MDDLRSGREYFDEARTELGYNECLECVDEEGYSYRPTTIDDIDDLSTRLSGSLDWLARRIAIELGSQRDKTMSHEEEMLEHAQTYASVRERRMRKMAEKTNTIISADRVEIFEGQPGFERNIIYASREQKQNQMNDESLKAGYDAQKLRLEQLEAWVSEVISRPSMSRDMRWQGLELLEEARSINPKVRKAVERICPRKFIEHGLELEQTIEL